jgi:hypothetical protein
VVRERLPVIVRDKPMQPHALLRVSLHETGTTSMLYNSDAGLTYTTKE